MRQACYVVGGNYDDGGCGSGSGNGVVSCQDCGNQAKKDCQHMRCRTCCRSRGLPCKTHVKSTWTPAAKRRERHQHLSLPNHQQNSGNQQLNLMMKSDGSGPDQNPKRPRQEHLHNNSSGDPGFHFPALMSSPAVFQCIRVSGVDDTNEQVAYQTAVSVGGHVFNGILYDHGPNPGQHNNHVTESSYTAAATYQDVNLIRSGTRAANSTTTSSIDPAVTIIHPSSTYPTPLCAFIAGTQLFPPPRS